VILEQDAVPSLNEVRDGIKSFFHNGVQYLRKGKSKMDRWDRKTDFGCNSCMFYVPKKEHSTSGNLAAGEGRCRRYAPSMKGYPVVYFDDWCGEHKRGSNPVRDSQQKEKQELSIGS